MRFKKDSYQNDKVLPGIPIAGDTFPAGQPEPPQRARQTLVRIRGPDQPWSQPVVIPGQSWGLPNNGEPVRVICHSPPVNRCGQPVRRCQTRFPNPQFSSPVGRRRRTLGFVIFFVILLVIIIPSIVRATR